VLLPECILQVLLWRGGYRTSIGLLSEEEEENLHKAGTKLIGERDWVRDIVRIRELRESYIQRSTTEVYHSASGRMKRKVAAPKSYKE
jgi:hypothetical protein